MLLLANQTIARLLGTIRKGQKVHLYIIGPANTTISIARFRHIIEGGNNFLYNPLQYPGILITNANGPVEIAWEGELWYISPFTSTLIPFEASIEGKVAA